MSKDLTKLWLWKNFVDGRPEYWAFDNPFPCETRHGDPLTLGEPCGYALLKESECGRDDINEATVIEKIKIAQAKAMTPTYEELKAHADMLAEALNHIAHLPTKSASRIAREALAKHNALMGKNNG